MLRIILAFTGLCLLTLTSAACVSTVDESDGTQENVDTVEEDLRSATFKKPVFRCVKDGLHTFWIQKENCDEFLTGRTLEGTAFYLRGGAGAGTVPLYIVFKGQQTVLTTNPQEVQGLLSAGWAGGGGIGHVAKAQGKGLAPLFRLYNPKNADRIFTVNPNERASLLGAGWVEEATGAYVSAT